MAKRAASPQNSPHIATQTELSGNALPEIAEALNGLLAASFLLTLHQTREFSLACLGLKFPRLPPIDG